MSFVLPNGPSRLAGRVALRQVGSGQDEVGAATVIPFCAPLKKTLAELEKPVPLIWIWTSVAGVGVWTGVLVGTMLVILGVAARTANGSELLVRVPTFTAMGGVPATESNDAAIVAVSCVSETGVVVTPVIAPFH